MWATGRADSQATEDVRPQRSESRPMSLVRNPDQRDSPDVGVAPSSARQVLRDAAQARSEKLAWERRYRARVFLADALAVIAAVTIAQVGRFGFPEAGEVDSNWVKQAVYSAILAVIWLAALGAKQSWDLSLAGVGSEEYRRVISATGLVFGIIAATALVFRLYPYRGYLLIALPLGLIGLIVGRHLLRRSLARRRALGEFSRNVLILGRPSTVRPFCESLGRDPSAGYKVIGACVPGFAGDFGESIDTPSGPIPVLGDLDCVEDALELTNADTLAVSATDDLGAQGMRTLAWKLDAMHVDVIVVPGVTDIAGPRLRIRQVDNLPLFQIMQPRHDGPARIQKRVFDLFFGTCALIALLPLLATAALAIKLDDGGPVFFRQQRPGYRGIPFRIIKFRTMRHEPKPDQHTSSQSDVVFYQKTAADSRITRVGRFLRKTSIDEIPQIFNVLGGSMSLVGPRPLLPGEGIYVPHYLERLALVKPGMTGLWQVSGRSDVSPEERVRLDHSYIDNWSPISDFVICLRTIRAVLKKQGAY